jgi:hypothetical protein
MDQLKATCQETAAAVASIDAKVRDKLLSTHSLTSFDHSRNGVDYGRPNPLPTRGSKQPVDFAGTDAFT